VVIWLLHYSTTYPQRVIHDGTRHHRLLLGQIAAAVQERKMLREAKAFFRFFQHISWERRLDEAVRSGSPDVELSE
jgi:hypothetical protein